jgi:putative DNA primase/helicase
MKSNQPSSANLKNKPVNPEVTQETQANINKILPFDVSSVAQEQVTQETDLVKEWPRESNRPCWGVYDEDFLRDGKVKRKRGVWRHKIQFNGEDRSPKLIDIWVSGPIHVEAITSSEESDFGRLLKLQNVNIAWKTWSMPMTMLGGSQEALREELLRLGMELNLKEKSLLSEYINTRKPEKRLLAAQKTGWNKEDTFVFPNKTVGDQNVIFQSNQKRCSDYSEMGSLSEWQKEIGELCVGNPLLLHAVAFSLAGPLLKILHIDNGGFHYYAESSTGKTTALLVAISLWGKPKQFIRTWRATSNGLEATSTDRNDTVLVLDELGEANPTEVDNLIYEICNGIGKQRATKHGTAQKTSNWRQTILSSGELSPEALLSQNSKSAQAGILLRLIDINCNHQYGLFDELHHFDSGREFSDHLKRSSDQNYGMVGPEFIKHLVELDHKQLNNQFALIRDQFTCNHNQENRVATRFALAAFAGELAIKMGILPWPQNAPIAASLGLFREWQASRGKLSIEDQKILTAIRNYVYRYGDSRFTDLNAPKKTISDRTGWWKMDKEHERRVWMFTSGGLQQAAQTNDVRPVIRALNNAGWIVAKDSGKSSKYTYIPGDSKKRLYHITVEEMINE